MARTALAENDFGITYGYLRMLRGARFLGMYHDRGPPLVRCVFPGYIPDLHSRDGRVL